MERDESFELFRTYSIAGMSGEPGSKLREGDRQAPEGFYHELWQNLKVGYDFFEKKKRPPNVEVEAGRYVFETDPGPPTRP